jgi:hypothetical protein
MNRETKILEIENELSQIRSSVMNKSLVNATILKQANATLERVNREMLEIKMDIVRDSKFNRDFFYIYIEIENLKNALNEIPLS